MSKQPYRILLAKIGLDGHDRGVKVLARSFRDAGHDVIYTGLWQTAQATMCAAMQEDVDVVGVSLLSAAHMTIMPEVLKWRKQYGIEHVPVVLGGIIPVQDYDAMRKMGVAALFNPGSSIEEILKEFSRLAAEASHGTLEEVQAGYTTGDQVALAKLITHIQRDTDGNGWAPPAGDALVLGITGSPGVGKSSFIDKLGRELRSRNLRVAVVAVDPSSPLTGGALLGDRLRMMSGSPDENFFIRSLSSGTVLGGLGPKAKEVVSLLSGFGFDIILLETVGAGQSDVAVRELARHTLLLLMPDSGDSIQFSKAGLMEIATCFVLNKCDLEGADRTLAHLATAVGGDRPLWKVSTLHNEGIDKVADWVVAQR
ncbi:MAG: cobalamin-dependent protein [Phycisphaerae bacterium]|nr:cobalamin-dependent protein [Phycisphaerae bacterium]